MAKADLIIGLILTAFIAVLVYLIVAAFTGSTGVSVSAAAATFALLFWGGGYRGGGTDG